MLNRTTLARPYARAAFLAAREEGALARWSEQLAVLAAVVSDEQVQPLLTDPRINREDLLAMFNDVAGGELGEDVRNFLQILADNGRLSLLPDVFAQYEFLRREIEQRIQVRVTSAQPMSDEESASLAAKLKARYGREVDLDIEVDAHLIGGAVIRAGDEVIDGSVRGRLERLARQVAV